MIIDNRADWLLARRKGIGASEAAAVLGISNFKSNRRLWEEKTGLRQPEDISSSERVQYGKEAEQSLRQLFILDFPEYLVEYDEFGMIANLPEYPWMFATLDGALTERSTGRRGVLEIKTTEIMNSGKWKEWDNAIPDSYFVQVCHQLLATGYQFAILKAQIKYRKEDALYITTRHYHMERTDENVRDMMETLLQKEVKFWDCVCRRTPPPLLLPNI